MQPDPNPPLLQPKPRTPEEMRRDALQIWQAGLEAVKPDRLLSDCLHIDGHWLLLEDEVWDLRTIRRIVVVGAGKAGGGMAAALERILGRELLREKEVTGWVNVPANGICPTQAIHLHPARPAGMNEPRPEGVYGSEEILRLVGAMEPNDFCICLLSGGGSALLPAPVVGITLEDKLQVTRHLSASGANIEQLNTVRKQLSRIKGGGLARHCQAGSLLSLIISDVPGDHLDVIASGPTVFDTSTPDDALNLLNQFQAREAGVSENVFNFLRRNAAFFSPDHLKKLETLGTSDSEHRRGKEFPRDFFDWAKKEADEDDLRPILSKQVIHFVIGNNATAVDAAGMVAERLGYSHAMFSAREPEGSAEAVGRHLAEMALHMRANPGPNCLISGGEPVVHLVESARRGLGGRNQQLVLAALDRLYDDGANGIVLLSGGTDGEDGPTDAAGAILCATTLSAAKEGHLQPNDYLARNDAYHFFSPLDALLRTGPTQTNVGDLRIVIVDQK